MDSIAFDGPELTVLLDLLVPWAFSALLSLARAGAMLLALPGWNHRGVPVIAKGGLVVGLASTMALSSPSPAVPVTFGLAIGPLLVMEFLYGFVIGFVFALPIHTAKMAGQIMGIEMGLSFSAVSDPLSQSNATVLSAIVGALAVQLVFALGIDRELIAAVATSTHYRPLGTLSLSLHVFSDLLAMGTQVFTLAFKLALPALGSLFALKLSMAYLARLAPKLQIFSLTFLLTLLVGQWVVLKAMPSVGAALADEYSRVVGLIWSIAKMVPDGPR